MDFLNCLFSDTACSGWDAAKIGIGLILLLLGWVKIMPAARLLARTIYRDRGAVVRYLAAARDLAQIFMTVGLKEKLIAAARHTVEWQVLNQPQRMPTLIDTVAARMAEAPAQRKFLLAQAHDEWAPAKLRYRQFIRPAWRQDRRRILSGLLNPDVPHTPRLRLNNVFDLLRVEDEIRHYFDTLARERSTRIDHADRFLAEIEIAEGFLAPLHLISGLQDRFDEDWEPVINYFDRRLRDEPHEGRQQIDPQARALRRRVLFQFVCWLVWGPSIPPCTCRRWHGWRTRPVFQFGYGDENNSIPIAMGENEAASTLLALFDAMRPWLAQRIAVVGTLHWGPSLDSAAFCPVQQDVRSVDEERLVLQCRSLSVSRGGTDAAVNALYYSAYIWVMFEVLPAEGMAVAASGQYPDAGTPAWERLLPFFEHGNLAEAGTLTTLKRQLALKALEALTRILQANPGVQLRYVCAIDDSNCFEDGVRRNVQFPDFEGQTIRELMSAAMRDAACWPPAATAEGQALRGRLLLDSATATQAFSACAMPQWVTAFQEALAGSPDEPSREQRGATRSGSC